MRRRFLSGLVASAALMLLVPAAPAGAKETPDRYDDVVAVSVLPNGDTEVTMYSPAPGVTSRQLHNSLQRAGVTGLLSPDAPPAGTFDEFQCYYGTAYALDNGKCPAINWRKNGRVRPQVHFNDHTSAAWPVNASAKKWNESVVIDVTYGTGWCAGYGAHCVHAYNANYGDNKLAGWVSRQIDSQRAFVDATVYFNDYYPNGHRRTTCHELGHAIGVGHNASRSSCMWTGPGDDAQYPNSDDYGLLQYVVYRT